MKYINETRILELLKLAQAQDVSRIDDILGKSRELKRLSLEEAASLLAVSDKKITEKIFSTAAFCTL